MNLPSLNEIVGQPCVDRLREFVLAPYPSCWLLEGTGGIGKTATAYAVATARKLRSSGIEAVVDGPGPITWEEAVLAERRLPWSG